MKTLSTIPAILFVISLSFLFSCSAKEGRIHNSKKVLNDRLESLQSKDPQGFYLAVFSLKGPQNQKVAQIVSENPEYIDWQSLEASVDSLNEEEKALLIPALKKEGYITEDFVSRLENWCMGRNTYQTITNQDSLAIERFVDRLYRIPEIQQMANAFILLEGQYLSGLSSYQLYEFYYRSLNVISALPAERQAEIRKDVRKRFRTE